MAQFIIQVDRTNSGWTVQIKNHSAGITISSFELLRSESLSAVPFPLPPQDRMQMIPAGEAHHALCLAENIDQREQLLECLLKYENNQNKSEVSLFGRYLFETLIGIENWKTMVVQAAGDEIELILSWKSDDATFNHLPWETMHPGAGHAGLDPLYQARFLAACSRVTIYRRVEGTQGKIESIQNPPRVLFVIGSDLNKDVIRPGAEYLGLLRRLNVAGQAIHSRILFDADIESLHDAVQEYKPHVVHFICHGKVLPGQPPYLVMNPSDPAKAETANVTASRLAEIFKETQPTPILVINACSMATTNELAIGQPITTPLNDLAIGRPFTTQLVELGLPVVLGMGGRITDQACRMFTQGFYQALLKGGRIAHAASLGRRAAIINGGLDAANQIDWALPVLFLAEGMDRPEVILNQDSALNDLQRAARLFTPDRTEPFCDRLEMLRQYEYLMRSTSNEQGAEKNNFPGLNQPVQALALYNVRPENASDKIGRTWLLQEMAAQAMRDGHVPVLLTLEMVQGFPHTLKEYFDDMLSPALNQTWNILLETRQHKNLTWDGLTYLETLFSLNKGDPAPENFPDGTPFPKNPLFRKDNPTESLMVGKILALELKKFLEAVREQRPEPERAAVRLLLLFDDLHRAEFGSELLKVIYSADMHSMINDLRIVIAYETLPSSGDNKSMLISVLENYSKKFWVSSAQLEPFHNPFTVNWHEDDRTKARLVYKQYMLQSIDKVTKLSRAYIFTPPGLEKIGDNFINRLAKQIKGIPSRLRIADDFIEYELENNNIRLANDDEVLAKNGE